jgi:hypothetical protein
MHTLSERRIDALFWTAAVLCLALGAGTAWGTFRSLGSRAARLGEKRAELAALDAIAHDAAAVEQARAALAALPQQRPADLDAVRRAAHSAPAPADTRETRVALSGGWVLRRRELDFESARLADVLELAHAAERSGLDERGAVRPPWRLTRVVFRGAPGEPGRGRVAIRLDALERSATP